MTAVDGMTVAAQRPQTPDDRMRIYAGEVLDRMCAWAWWHFDRGTARGLGDGEGSDALFSLTEAIAELERVIEAGAGGLLISTGFWVSDGVAHGFSVDAAGAEAAEFIAAVTAVDAALDDARDAAASEWCSNDAQSVEAYQAKEIETSAMRQLWGDFLGIEEDRRFARDGVYSETEAQLIACERLAFTPGAPVQEACRG